MDECNALREWAETTPAEPPLLADRAEAIKIVRYMNAVLPSKIADEETGEMRASIYANSLRGYSVEALQYMARRAVDELRWFPTMKDCLDLLAQYRPPPSEQSTALRLCQVFAQDAFDQWLVNLADGQPIGDVPDSWKRIAMERGYLRLMPDGDFISRAEVRHG